jgi:hypothetical protein
MQGTSRQQVLAEPRPTLITEFDRQAPFDEEISQRAMLAAHVSMASPHPIEPALASTDTCADGFPC